MPYHASSSKLVTDAGGELPEEMHKAPRQANYSYLSCCNIALSWMIHVAVNTKLANQQEKAGETTSYVMVSLFPLTYFMPG